MKKLKVNSKLKKLKEGDILLNPFKVELIIVSVLDQKNQIYICEKHNIEPDKVAKPLLFSAKTLSYFEFKKI